MTDTSRDNPSNYYAVPENQRLDSDVGEGSNATDPGGVDEGDDTELLDEIRNAPDQEFGTMGSGEVDE